MGVLTSEHPKCMTELSSSQTILSRQLSLLCEAGVGEVVMTTGYNEDALREYCRSLDLPIEITFVRNPIYDRTNYIYSIYCARDYLRGDDLILMHGDLVFENTVFDRVMQYGGSCMAVSSTAPVPQKDFKAVVEGNKIVKVGVEFFGDGALAAQPLYKLRREDWETWLDGIVAMCGRGETKCYAENALNEVGGRCDIRPLDIGDMLCSEIDTPEDYATVKSALHEVESRTVYMCFSTDIVHSGHISIIHKAQRLGRLVVGVLSDEAVSSFRHYPMVPFSQRCSLFRSIEGVSRVIRQDTLSYRDVIRTLRPYYVVHGDDWRSGFQRPVREEVCSLLEEYGGHLVEFPYTRDEVLGQLETLYRSRLSMPDMRRARLSKLIGMKGLVTALEAHSGITGLIVENTTVLQDGKTYQFDAMWLSSLCDSTAKGKPDIELVDLSSRLRTVDEIMDVTTKPIIFDGDTGGLPEHFTYTVRTLERMGVSMVVIEDKVGLKRNSLFGTEVPQTQDDVEHFCRKITAGRMARKSPDFMICARIESLILGKGEEDALSRARAYVRAGADAIMIHSRKKDPGEIFSFVESFRREDAATPIVVVPTSFDTVTEEEFKRRGVNVVIYANQLTRSGFPAMQETARTILRSHRAAEADESCMPIRDIITLIPEQ